MTDEFHQRIPEILRSRNVTTTMSNVGIVGSMNTISSNPSDKLISITNLANVGGLVDFNHISEYIPIIDNRPKVVPSSNNTPVSNFVSNYSQKVNNGYTQTYQTQYIEKSQVVQPKYEKASYLSTVNIFVNSSDKNVSMVSFNIFTPSNKFINSGFNVYGSSNSMNYTPINKFIN
jgi:hypothetical protein